MMRKGWTKDTPFSFKNTVFQNVTQQTQFIAIPFHSLYFCIRINNNKKNIIMAKTFRTKKSNSKQYPNMVYIDPEDVNAPQDYIISKKVIFDGGLHSFAVAEVNWEGGIGFGIRWNVSRREWERDDKIDGINPCYGMPFSTATPVWFIIPKITYEAVKDIIEKEEKELKEEDYYYKKQ